MTDDGLIELARKVLGLDAKRWGGRDRWTLRTRKSRRCVAVRVVESGITTERLRYRIMRSAKVTADVAEGGLKAAVDRREAMYARHTDERARQEQDERDAEIKNQEAADMLAEVRAALGVTEGGGS